MGWTSIGQMLVKRRPKRERIKQRLMWAGKEEEQEEAAKEAAEEEEEERRGRFCRRKAQAGWEAKAQARTGALTGHCMGTQSG